MKTNYFDTNKNYKLFELLHNEHGIIAIESELQEIERVVLNERGRVTNNRWFIGFVLVVLMFIGYAINKENVIAAQNKTIKLLQRDTLYNDAIIQFQHKEIIKANLYMAENYPIQVSMPIKIIYRNKPK